MVPKTFTQISASPQQLAIFETKNAQKLSTKKPERLPGDPPKKKDGLKGLPSTELTYPPDKAYLKMMFLFPRWDMLVSLDGITHFSDHFSTNPNGPDQLLPALHQQHGVLLTTNLEVCLAIVGFLLLIGPYM